MTVNLITGEHYQPRLDDYITKSTAVAPGGDCPRWRTFIDKVTNGDTELSGYLQRVVGYSLTGDTSEHAVFFLYGTGANGKSVFMNTLVGVMGVGSCEREDRTMLKRIIAALALTLMASTAMAAGTWDDGLDAFESGDYAEAVGHWRVCSHDQGDVWCQTMLGAMYNEGKGVPQDYAEAVRWYRLAADQGHADAQYALGIMYNDGRGITQDYVESAKWYRLAADQGDAGAQTNLGVMYAEGQGVPQDYVLAHMWLNLAAAQGAEKAINNRDIAVTLMTPAQIAEAQALARDWTAKQ